MRKEAIVYGLTVALGTVIGLLSAKVLFGQSLGWLGGLLGSVIGYVVIDFERVRKAVPKAWAKVSGIEPDKEWFTGCFWSTLSGILMCLNVLLPLFLAFANVIPVYWMLLMIPAFFISVYAATQALKYTSNSDPNQFDKRLALYANPIAVYLVWPVICFVKVIAWVLARMPRALAVTWQILKAVPPFLWEMIRVVHSYKRLLCALDITIMFGLTYQLGLSQSFVAILVAALLGYIGGLIHYQLISVGLLGITPNGHVLEKS